jgi:hypothetical protein
MSRWTFWTPNARQCGLFGFSIALKNGSESQNVRLGREWKRSMARIFVSHSSRDNDAAAQMKTWLASHGFETTFLDLDEAGGIRPGADWEKTLYREIEQSQAVVIIETPKWVDSKSCFAE